MLGWRRAWELELALFSPWIRFVVEMNLSCRFLRPNSTRRSSEALSCYFESGSGVDLSPTSSVLGGVYVFAFSISDLGVGIAPRFGDGLFPGSGSVPASSFDSGVSTIERTGVSLD